MRKLWLVAALLVILPSSAHAGNCPGVSPTDNLDDTQALQACLNRGGLTELDRGNPGYIIHATLAMNVNYTQLAGANGKAKILAASDLFGPMLRVKDSLVGYQIHEMIFDGNLWNRTRYNDCHGYRDFGSNLILRGARDITECCGSPE
jgi:hypothetical protein